MSFSWVRIWIATAVLLAVTGCNCGGNPPATIGDRKLVSIAVTPGSVALVAGQTQDFQAQGSFSDGTSEDLSGSVSWSSSATTIVSVSSAGRATGVAPGSAQLTASKDGIRSNAATVTVSAPARAVITLTPTSATVPLGGSRAFKATLTQPDGSSQDVTATAAWASSDARVAVVDASSGVVTAVGAGTCTLTASQGGVTSEPATLTVTAPVITSISLTPGSASVAAGQTQAFTATATLSDGSTEDVTATATWASSASTVATVGANGVATGKALGTASITASKGGITSNSATLTVRAPVIVFIALAPDSASITVGRTQAFTATATLSDGSTRDVTATATWDSSDPAVATVNSSGVAAGVATGTTNLTATLAGVTSSGATLTVTAPVITAIAVTPASASVPMGRTQTFTATATLSDGSTRDVTATATWDSSDPAVATVDASGMATTLDTGTARITATQEGVASNAATLTVMAPVITSIDVTPGSAFIAVGRTRAFTATATLSDGSTRDVTNTATWASSAPAVATVNSSGVATGVANGTTRLTAAQAGVTSDPATLTVTAAAITSIAVTPTSASVPVGQTQAFTATATLSDGSTQNVTDTATWTSADPAVATVDATGMATGMATGTTRLTAAQGSVTSNSATLTVTAPVITSIDVTPASASVAVGRTLSFTATATLSDGSTRDVTNTATWASSDSAVATVNASGVATGVAMGTTRITAALAGVTSNNATLTVLGRTLESIALTPVGSSVARSFSVQLFATGTYSDGSIADLSATATWASATPSIATVSATGEATGVTAGTTVISATQDGVTGTLTLTVTSATLTSVAVTPNTVVLPVGVRAAMKATGFFSDNTYRDLTSECNWTTATPSVATVSNVDPTRGLVTGVAAGTTGVTATCSGVSGTAALTVNAATLQSVSVFPTRRTLPVGFSLQYGASGLYSDGNAYDLTLTATWSSSAPGIARVTNTLPDKGYVTGLSVGTATLSAVVGGTVGSTPVTVSSGTLESISITPPLATRAAGLTVQLSATGYFSDGTFSDITELVAWSSSAPAVASVSNAAGSRGLAAALSAGTATLTATLAGQSASAALTVTNATLRSIQISPANQSIGIAGLVQYSAVGLYDDGTSVDLTQLATWASSNATVVTVRNDAGSQGIATGVAAGTASVTATFGTVSGSTLLTVTSATLVEIYVAPALVTIGVNTTQQFTAAGIWTDGSTADLTVGVTWTSSSTSVATISNVAGSWGLATGVAVGSTTITAQYAGRTDATTLTVTSAALVSLSVTPATQSLPAGVTSQYRAIGTYAGGLTQDLTTQVSWTSSAPAIAAIGSAAGSEGLATTLYPGTAVITARLGTVSATANLTVTSATLTALTVTPIGARIPVEFWRQYKAVATFNDGSSLDVTSLATWSTSNTTIAAANNAPGQSGQVKGLSAGTVTVRATYLGVTASVSADITAATLVSITITPANPAIRVGVPLQLTATGTFSDGSTLDITQQVGWKVAPKKNATVSNSVGSRGVVTATVAGRDTNVLAQWRTINGTTKVSGLP